MNLLDLFLLTALAAAVVGGYRLGFLARLFSWLGLAVGAVVALKFAATLGRALDRSSEQTRLIAVLGLFIAIAMIGQGLGLALGTLLHFQIRATDDVRRGDRVAGGAVGGLGILCVIWLVAPSLAEVEGWPSREADRSAIVRTVHRLTPNPPEVARSLESFVGDDASPLFNQDLGGSPGAVPEFDLLSDAVELDIQASTVKVSGRACSRIQEGSGFFVRPDLVITNGHVVAGETFTEIETLDGTRHPVRVVAFDPAVDVAILALANLEKEPLRIAAAGEDVTSEDGSAVFGHPAGRKLNIRPANVESQITATGTDIYRDANTRREVLILAAQMFPGDSGAPLVAPDGTVIGLAFAIDPKHREVSYALATEEFLPIINGVPLDRPAVSTGPCLAEG